MLSEKTYPCVFDPETACPVRKEFKLAPENLVKFCETCKVNQKEIINVINGMLPMFLENRKKRTPTEILGDLRDIQEVLKGIKSMSLK